MFKLDIKSFIIIMSTIGIFIIFIPEFMPIVLAEEISKGSQLILDIDSIDISLDNIDADFDEDKKQKRTEMIYGVLMLASLGLWTILHYYRSEGENTDTEESSSSSSDEDDWWNYL